MICKACKGTRSAWLVYNKNIKQECKSKIWENLPNREASTMPNTNIFFYKNNN
jgi:hypothetical protein